MVRLLALFFVVILGATQFVIAATSQTDSKNSAEELKDSSNSSRVLILDRSLSSSNREVDPNRTTNGSEVVHYESSVFGSQLFRGEFKKSNTTIINPGHVLGVGDKLQVRFWGALNFDGLLVVDNQGKIFIPGYGPIQVLGVRASNIQEYVDRTLKSIYKNNVNSYVALASAQPLAVFVGGWVNKPGLYEGTSQSSLISFLDAAGGIDPERGSFLELFVKRGGDTIKTINLYDFLLHGELPYVQFQQGDVIFVSPRKSYFSVAGLISNNYAYEFNGTSINLSEIISMVRPDPGVSHVRIKRRGGAFIEVNYIEIGRSENVNVLSGDQLTFVSDRKQKTISVRVEGEHDSPHEYVLPYGSKLGDVLNQVKLNTRSDLNSVQLYRESVKVRQKQLLALSLKTLESSVLTVRSGTTSEATLHAEEAKLILNWVERAKNIEPIGQVVLKGKDSPDSVTLEDGDRVKIPGHDDLVLVGGEVVFPNAVRYEAGVSASEYISKAGGFTQNADTSRVIVAHKDGTFEETVNNIKTGDEILVLPKIDVKSREIAKDMIQMVYQIAVAARVVLGF